MDFNIYQLLNYMFHEFPEREVGMLSVEVLNELGDNFGVSLTLKHIPIFLQERFHFLVIGNDPVVDYNEGVLFVWALRVRIHLAWNAVSGPASVGNAAVIVWETIHFQVLTPFWNKHISWRKKRMSDLY